MARATSNSEWMAGGSAVSPRADPPQERAASLELAGRRTSPETRSALPGKRLWPRLCRWQTGRTRGAFRGTNREPGRLVDSLHEPERRFATGLAGPHAPRRLETGAPPRFGVLPVCNRQSPRRPDCHLQTGSTFLGRAGVRGNVAHAVQSDFLSSRRSISC